MKPVSNNKAGEMAMYYGSKKQYYPGKKSFMKKRAAKDARRVGKLNIKKNE
jgi:hypothetical protein